MNGASSYEMIGFFLGCSLVSVVLILGAKLIADLWWHLSKFKVVYQVDGTQLTYEGALRTYVLFRTNSEGEWRRLKPSETAGPGQFKVLFCWVSSDGYQWPPRTEVPLTDVESVSVMRA